MELKKSVTGLIASKNTDLFGQEINTAVAKMSPGKPKKKEIVLKSAFPTQQKDKTRWLLRCRPNALVASYSFKHKESNHRTQPTKKNLSPGKLSINSARKLKQAIRWLVACSDIKKVYEKKYKRTVQWRINLATLTFHENLKNDKLARKILSEWIEVAKYRWQIKNYIWKAEPQQRGAIHFHVIFNQYIPHKELKYTWNRACRKHGLNNITDNSTDIHADTNIDSIEAYLTDYMLDDSKHKGRRLITGRLWGCSHSLSQAGKKYLIIDKDEFKSIANELDAYSLATIKTKYKEEVPKFLQYTGYYVLPQNWYNDLPECQLRQQWFSELELLRQTRQVQLFPIALPQ